MNLKYINHFFSLKAAHDLLPFFTGCKKTAAKEVTESFGAYHNTLETFGAIDNSWIVASVGDGKRPRTGGVFRFLTKAYKVWSIDPNADENWLNGTLPEIFGVHVRDMEFFKSKVEDLSLDCEGKNLLILGVHSHASLNNSIKAFKNYKRLDVFWMPCCKEVDTNWLDKEFIQKKVETFTTFKDREIWSAKNQIYCWKNVNVGQQREDTVSQKQRDFADKIREMDARTEEIPF